MRGPPATGDILRAAVDQTAAPIVIADALGRITYANGAVTALVGLPLDRIRGRHFSSLVASDEPLGDVEQIAARVAAGQTWSRPILGRRRDGSRLTWICSFRRCGTSTARSRTRSRCSAT